MLSKNKVHLPIILFLSLILILVLGNLNYLKTITGQATSQQATVNVTVSVPVPSITIVSPKNNTYISNASILLNYTSSYARVLWYNLNNGPNSTITQSVYINAPLGQNTLYLYANNTDNVITSKNVTFVINNTKYYVLYSNYQNSGNTTDFYKYSFEELQNLENVVIEKEAYGAIIYPSARNITRALNTTAFDIDNQVNISNNRIYVNSTELIALNNPATLILRNLSFVDPQILKDGEECSSSICTEQSYSAGSLIFNVTSFSTYSAQETPSTGGTTNNQGSSGGGGGGGSTNVVPRNILIVDPLTISVKLDQGETKRREIEIKNNYSSSISVKISTEKIDRYVKVSETELTLGPGETKKIQIDLIAPETSKVETILGKIVFNTGNEIKETLVSIDIGSPKALFDVSLDIPQNEIEIETSRVLLAVIKITNLGETNRVDAILEYTILNEDGSTVLHETESAAVETQAGLVKQLVLPRTLKTGKYLLSVKAKYQGEEASASVFFDVKQAPNRAWYIVITIVATLAAVGITILIIYNIIKIVRLRRKIRPKSKR